MRGLVNRRTVAVAGAAIAGALVLAACDTGDYTVRFVVGQGGIILKTADAGASWTQQVSGTKRNLFAVSFIGTQNGCTVGAGGVILYTTDGTTWNRASVVPSTKDLFGVATQLVSTEGGSTSEAYAVGERGTILTSPDCVTWTLQVSGTTRQLNAVSTCSCGNPDAWTVGDKGTILATRDGGVTWTPQVSGTSATLESVSFVDAFTGWAVGKGGIILATTDGGATWVKQSSGTTSSLDGVVFSFDRLHGYAVGFEGLIIATSDGGATWTRQNSTTTSNLESVSTIAESARELKPNAETTNPNDWHDAIAVGKNGVIVMTQDGGTTWTQSPSGTTRNLAGTV